MDLRQQAKNIQGAGRYGDTAILHVNPAELEGIASLVPGGKLTINPETGQPEAFLGALLGGALFPTLFGGTAFGTAVGSAGLTGIGAGLGSYIESGNLGNALLSGALSFGLGSLMSGEDSVLSGLFGGAETAATATEATTSLPGTSAFEDIGESFDAAGLSSVAPTEAIAPTFAGAEALASNPASEVSSSIIPGISDKALLIGGGLGLGAIAAFAPPAEIGDIDEDIFDNPDIPESFPEDRDIFPAPPGFRHGVDPEHEFFKPRVRGFQEGGQIDPRAALLSGLGARGAPTGFGALNAPPPTVTQRPLAIGGAPAPALGGFGALSPPGPQFQGGDPINYGNRWQTLARSGQLPAGTTIDRPLPLQGNALNALSGSLDASRSGLFNPFRPQGGVLPPGAPGTPGAPGAPGVPGIPGVPGAPGTGTGGTGTSPGTSGLGGLGDDDRQGGDNDGGDSDTSGGNQDGTSGTEGFDAETSAMNSTDLSNAQLDAEIADFENRMANPSFEGKVISGIVGGLTAPGVFSAFDQARYDQNIRERESRGALADLDDVDEGFGPDPVDPGFDMDAFDDSSDTAADAEAAADQGDDTEVDEDPGADNDGGGSSDADTDAGDDSEEDEDPGADSSDDSSDDDSSDDADADDDSDEDDDPGADGDDSSDDDGDDSDDDSDDDDDDGDDDDDAAGGLIRRHFQEGGQIDMPPEQRVIIEAEMALKGNHPKPKVAIAAFIQMYGQKAFAQLRKKVINEMNAGQRQQAGVGSLVHGAGTGLSDDVPANIDGQEEVNLSDGEYIVPADVVSDIGDGSTNAGSKRLDGMLDRVRKKKHGTTKQPSEIRPAEILPR